MTQLLKKDYSRTFQEKLVQHCCFTKIVTHSSWNPGKSDPVPEIRETPKIPIWILEILLWIVILRWCNIETVLPTIVHFPLYFKFLKLCQDFIFLHCLRIIIFKNSSWIFKGNSYLELHRCFHGLLKWKFNHLIQQKNINQINVTIYLHYVVAWLRSINIIVIIIIIIIIIIIKKHTIKTSF